MEFSEFPETTTESVFKTFGHHYPVRGEILDDGRLRFRLWAPMAFEVSLDLSTKRLSMYRLDDGWFELITGEAGPGTRYQFRIDRLNSVPDPASRYQPFGVHGPSEVIDPKAFPWKNISWH